MNSTIDLLNNAIQVIRITNLLKNAMKSKNETNENFAKDKFEILFNLYNSIILKKIQ